jgi:hypothetical protein
VEILLLLLYEIDEVGITSEVPLELFILSNQQHKWLWNMLICMTING